MLGVSREPCLVSCRRHQPKEASNRCAVASGVASSGSRLCGTKKRRATLVVVCVAAIAVTATVVVVNAGRVNSDSFQIPAVLRTAYKAPSKSLLTNCEIRFSRLSDAQLSKVRFTPVSAAHIASSQYGNGRRSRVVFESLGGYVDTNQIIPDWVGTKSWVPKALPAYLVRIGGDDIDSLGPRPTEVENHFWNVIVNATTGKIVGATTYD
jgi:hypothetical protein